jgi:segregation and condensation protein B
VTFGTTDAFLEHYGLATLADLPGVAEMKAAGLLEMNLPPGFNVPDPLGLRVGEDEDPLDDGDEAPEFAQDFLGDLEKTDPA